MNEDASADLELYRLHARGTSNVDPKVANRHHAKMHAAYKRMRASDLGRSMISRLLDDEDPHIRLWAAAHSLEWSRDAALKALEELRDSDGPCSFDAGMTIKEYEKGRLTFD